MVFVIVYMHSLIETIMIDHDLNSFVVSIKRGLIKGQINQGLK